MKVQIDHCVWSKVLRRRDPDAVATALGTDLNVDGRRFHQAGTAGIAGRGSRWMAVRFVDKAICFARVQRPHLISEDLPFAEATTGKREKSSLALVNQIEYFSPQILIVSMQINRMEHNPESITS